MNNINKKLCLLILFIIYTSHIKLKSSALYDIAYSIYEKYNNQNSNIFSSQTISHLNNQNILNKLQLKNYGFYGNYNYYINAIGKNKLIKIFDKAIDQEIKQSNKNKYIFYHAQNRSFLLYQDIHKKIIGKIYKKTISDFILLRIPDKNSNKYKNTKEFLNKFKFDVWDTNEPFKSILLSANPSLFSNTAYNPSGESTFEYFIMSKNANYVNHLSFIEDLFNHFQISGIYNKYNNDIYSLYNLISSYETDKTGLMLQICIDASDVNNFVYQAKPWGIPKTLNSNLVANTLNNLKKTSILNKYSISNFSISNFHAKEIDQIQFRILLNNQFIKNKNNKIFRYYNKTKNIIQYKHDFKELTKKIHNELDSQEKIDTNITMFSIDNIKSTFSKITQKLETLTQTQ